MSVAPQKLLKFFEFYESIVEDDMPFDLEFGCQPFQTKAVGFTLLSDKVRMSRSQDDINDVRKFLHDSSKSPNNMLDCFSGRKQTESEQNLLSLHAELILVKIGINKRHVRNAMRNHVDVVGRNRVNFLQHLPNALAHDN